MFRRFDAVVDYPLPTLDVTLMVIKNRLASVKTTRLGWARIDEASAGLSHSEAAAAEAAAKDTILSEEGVITTDMLCVALRERRIRHGGLPVDADS